MNRIPPRFGSMSRLLRPAFPLLAMLATSSALGNTYYKCTDSKGAVTVQQSACVVSSSQEEKKVWISGAPLAPPTIEGRQPVATENRDAAKGTKAH
jgi:Domain of unknown function (DUF4124)